MKLNKYIKKLCKNMQDTKRNLVLLNYKIPIRAPQFLEKTFFPHNSVDINLLLYLAFLCDFSFKFDKYFTQLQTKDKKSSNKHKKGFKRTKGGKSCVPVQVQACRNVISNSSHPIL